MSLTNTARDAEFILSEGDANYSRDLVTLGAEAGVKPAGTLLQTVNGKYVLFADQDDTCTGILINSTDTTADCSGVVLTRHAQVKYSLLSLSSYDAGDITKATGDLKTLGIIVRS